MTEFHSVPFYFSVAHGSQGRQGSALISGIKKIKRILMVYPQGTGLKLRYRFFQDTAMAVNPTGLPGGRELTKDEVDSGDFANDGISMWITIDKDPIDDPICLKMYAQNDSTSDFIAHAVIEVAK